LPDTLPLPDTVRGGEDKHDPRVEEPKHAPESAEPELASPPVTDSRAQAVWEPLLEELMQDSDAPKIGMWFEGVVPTAFEDSILVLQVPNSFALKYIETRFGERLRSVLTEQVGPGVKLSVRVFDGASSADYVRDKS